MRKALFSELRPGEQILFTILVFIISGLFFYGLALMTAALTYHLSLSEVFGAMSAQDEADAGILKLVQIISGAGNYVFTAFFVSLLFTGSWTAWFKGEHRPEANGMLLAVLMIVSAIPFVNHITEINMNMRLPFESLQHSMEKMEADAESITWILTKADNIGGLMINILMIAIIPGLGEELVFRGLIQKMFTGLFRNGHVAIIVTAIIFSALHLQFLSFFSRFFLGVLLGYLFYYGKSIWYPVLAHTFNNLLGVFFYYQAHKEGSPKDWGDIGTEKMFPWAAVISLFTFLLLFYLWYKNVREINQAPRYGKIQKD